MTHSSKARNKSFNFFMRKGDTSHITLSKEKSPISKNIASFYFFY